MLKGIKMIKNKDENKIKEKIKTKIMRGNDDLRKSFQSRFLSRGRFSNLLKDSRS